MSIDVIPALIGWHLEAWIAWPSQEAHRGTEKGVEGAWDKGPPRTFGWQGRLESGRGRRSQPLGGIIQKEMRGDRGEVCFAVKSVRGGSGLERHGHDTAQGPSWWRSTVASDASWHRPRGANFGLTLFGGLGILWPFRAGVLGLRPVHYFQLLRPGCGWKLRMNAYARTLSVGRRNCGAFGCGCCR